MAKNIDPILTEMTEENVCSIYQRLGNDNRWFIYSHPILSHRMKKRMKQLGWRYYNLTAGLFDRWIKCA